MSTARTPGQNGVVERRNRTLVEAARTMLSAVKVPLFFWAEAITTSCFPQNPSLVIPQHEKIPYHNINGRKPSVKFFYIFGSLCYIVIDGENLDKIKEKGDACIFVGYSTQLRAYRHGMTSCDSIGTPMATKSLDANLSGTPGDQKKYCSMVGALMYLTASRPDIIHATCYCARYQARPTRSTSKRLPRLHKSTYGGIQFLSGDKLGILLMRTQLTDYGFHFDKIPMYCDSKEAIAITCNPVHHSHTKHIDVRYHFIKEQVEKGIVELFFVGTEYQLADLFTKALPEDRFKYLIRRLGMRCLTPDELEVLAIESA
ncbi:retrovirus-related pol polyprotein from transposon TNT 1-94 [Tanacetum coccineum]|uniref:Retrovirus-related pol polyprotein from transposon TNT 1-94 n=1 Tax=Tanacetum coccineum TaxID=301880 RepID=A0ABQ5BRF8_9ASTR